MIIRALLHTHVIDDPKDFVPYSAREAFELAKERGINCIAFTCHDHFTPKEKYQGLANEFGILFISGIEKVIEGRDVVILNCEESVQTIWTMQELRAYKKEHPECFVFAPHPFFPGGYSLSEKLEANIDCFDAIELSWFYTKKINYNEGAKAVSEKYNLPLIATPDAHRKEYLTTGFVELEAPELSTNELFKGIREKRHANIHRAKTLLELFLYQIKFEISQIGKHKVKRKRE